MTDTGREPPEVWLDDVGMMSAPISWRSFGRVEEGEHAGKAEGVTLALRITVGLESILGKDWEDDRECNDKAGEAVAHVLAEYKGAEENGGGGDSWDHLEVEFSLEYEGDENDDEMIERFDRETDWRKFYDDAVLFLRFTHKVAAALGKRPVRDDFTVGDYYVDADDMETPDIWSTGGYKQVVYPPGSGKRTEYYDKNGKRVCI